MKRKEIDKKLLSPGMLQYYNIKEEYQNELLFFRLGDFYELFFEDALLASRELELTLTGKNGGLEEKIPMCGVPFHSATTYIEKLITKGYKVAICEQLTDPKKNKGIVERGVVAVYSSGSIVDFSILKSYDNNYIGSIIDFKTHYTITYSDLSTGHIYSTEIEYNLNKLISQILKINLKEIILTDNTNEELINTINNYNINYSISTEYLEEQYQEIYINEHNPNTIIGIKHLLYYLAIKELKDLSHIQEVEIIKSVDYLEMDIHTIRNLELTETLRLKERTNSLVWLLDKCKTSMGSRMLKNWILKPLRDKEKIEQRYNIISKLNDEFILTDNLRKSLNEVYDIERLCGKISCGNLNARDLLQLKSTLEQLPNIKAYMNELNLDLKIDTLKDIHDLLEKSIYETPPVTIKEGYIIKDGYNQELDELKTIRSGGKTFIAQLESQEREKTNIKTLKVGYNKVFGYYIEISKGQCHLVKDEYGYERRQTLTNCERFISPLLKEKEALVLNAEEKIVEIEYNLFIEIKNIIKEKLHVLKKNAESIAYIDTLSSLSICSSELNLKRPTITTEHTLKIINGRHPVVERLSKTEYVPNDCIMDESTNTLLITGPNMSGKSTYMRQLGIIAIMAQIGSFIPADEAIIPIFDKIFTRIGASDDLVSGESTFMVEMKEAENAINNATSNSLILFDELGRGTSTFDGMSLAQAILEYLNNLVKAKVLFSTHYHELTKLEEKISTLKNIHVSAIEENNNITFLHKIKTGAVDKSYGIHVAKLAMMPDILLKRAEEILKHYETNKIEIKDEQITFDFQTPKNEIKDKLDAIDITNITPLEALNLLNELKNIK